LDPFEKAFGSLDAFEAVVQAEIAAGKLDSEAAFLVTCARRWKKEAVWSLWKLDRIWEVAR
jgi:hypothetical protein